MAKSSNYWDKRALDRYNITELKTKKATERMKKIYRQAYYNVNKELESVYKNYSDSTGLDIQKLKELLIKSETEKTFNELKKQGLDKYVQENYKARINRLEQIKAQIYGKAKMVYSKEELEQTMLYDSVLNDNYYKTIYDTQMGTGYNFSFSKIDNNTMNSLLSEKWSGKNYSQRIWKNTDILAERLSTVVGAGLISGQSIEKISRQIRKEFDVAKYYSDRLARTESNYFHNQADMLAYQEMGVDKYVFVATLDSRTSEICQSMDNKKFDYDKIEVGVNYPPLHPNCRSTTRGYLGEEAERMLKRRSRNPITGKTETVDNIPYNEWLKRNNMVDNRYGMARSIYNIKYNTNSLGALDKNLVEINVKQLNKLLNKYPKVAEFVKDKGLIFGGKNTKAIAITSHGYDMTRIGIHLSNEYYKNERTYTNIIKNAIKTKQFMPCSENNIKKYALNHEFGHLVETHLINEYNIHNPKEYEAFKFKIENAKTKYEVRKAFKDYEGKICDNIAQDIYGIALKNNKDFKLNDNLSKYGKESSSEFFAECFANMTSGKPNELGRAMEEYLKGVM